MAGELGQPQAGPSHAGLDWPNPERNRAGVPGGVIRKVGSPGRRSWIQKILEQITDSPRQWVTPSEVVPVAVLAVQRYLLEDEPRDVEPKPPLYCYDVTISDGVYQEKCYLDPSLNFLVYKNILKVGIEMRISRVSCIYNERRLGQGILCIDDVHCGESLDAISLETPFRNSAHREIPERPLRGGKSHYLALWNNEDPYGDIWLNNKYPEEHNFNNTRIISLSHLEMIWSNRRTFPALLVRILHKSKLRYYGKPDKKMIEPYQTFLEVADSSGTVSVIMWNALCPEWYKSLRVGLVLLLQDYSVKKSYPFRIQPLPVDPQIKLISTMEICLNLRDPPTNIMIIPEKQVKPEWRLPKLNYRFITRSELDDMPENHICDVVGILVFVGRVQRSKKKESREDFWSYRWIHIADGTSEQPFIVELFSTSQPEIFENIYPMTYFVCTQLKVVRNDAQVPKLLYLTTTNESRVFINGHRGQPYINDPKVKNFNQWVKAKTDSGELKNTVIGGYYPYPPVPETFSKYSSSVKVESLLTAISEVRKEVEGLQYREQKRIAIQGIITGIKYVPHNSATENASASETLRSANQPSTSQANKREDQSQERDGRQNQEDSPVSSQSLQTASAVFSPSKKKRILQGPCAKLIPVPQSEPPAQTKGNKLSASGTSPRREGASSSNRGKARKTISDKWESQMWREKKFGLIDHLRYSRIYPESIPRKFVSEHRNFLARQYNSQPAKYVPPEGRPQKLDDFKSARSLGHFEVTILGLNHEIAIDVAFLPMYSPEDFRASQIATLLSCTNYSCVYSQEVTGSDRLPGPRALAGDIIKAASKLDRAHIVAILDICSLGNNKAEVYLHKIYRPDNTS
ncbi:RPA-related protein RADX [Camelus ferus]|uniref:RPA-related protein RADX n=2 Tax=Camelus TaxID=9836 RepID=A0A8B7KFW9_CAMFR|nr:RPA-related protein RADX [Camelus bactrianus]XP_010986055.1 RPA-related protein RADX [Camelus dromedarius]XP_014422666.1 RPA-related protein RADX [Camelus ferus]